MRKHLDILEELGLAYFQRCDRLTEAPTRYLERLAESDLLFCDFDDQQSADEFARICELIGRYSVAAGIVWAMHNQQWNMLREIAPTVSREVRAGGQLIASVTSRHRGSFVDALVPASSGYHLRREAPVCSYRYQAGEFLVAVPHKTELKTEDWLVLVPASDVQKPGEKNVLGVARSTLSGAVSINCTVAAHRVLGPLSSIHSKVFVPLAHLGWMSVYIGGLGGVLDRLRVLMRDGKLGDRKEDRLFRSRVSNAVAQYHVGMALVRECARVCFTGVPLRSVMLNVLKTEASVAASKGASALSDALGLRYSLTVGDPLGLETYCRDVRGAALMVHNDLFYEHLFDQWYTKMAGLADD